MTDPHAQEGLLRLGWNSCAVARARRIALLVDSAAYFQAFRQAADATGRAAVSAARTPLPTRPQGT